MTFHEKKQHSLKGGKDKFNEFSISDCTLMKFQVLPSNKLKNVELK